MNKPALITTLILGAAAATVAGFLLVPGLLAADVEPAGPTPSTSVTQPATVTPGTEGQVVVDSIAAAQDEAAMNDLSQISLGQALSLSTTGKVKSTLADLNGDGLTVTFGSKSAPELFTSSDQQHFIAFVTSDSGKVYWTLDGQSPLEAADRAAAVLAANTAATSLDGESQRPVAG